MIRAAIIAATLLFSVFGALAEEGVNPIIRAELEADTAIPGQPVVLRLTVLVPTWMPKPPVLPTFDLPNLMVRLPARATTPVSERIGGETWSGISRGYRLYPLIPGRIDIPAQTIRLHYADPETRQPVTADLTTDAFVLAGVIPKEATGLDPFVAANDIAAKQTFTGDLEDLEPGDAVTRQIRVDINGASPMVVPPMLNGGPIEGLSVYVKEPVIDEKSDRGVLSGTRIEAVTYVAQAGGRFAIPPVTLRWFDLDGGKIETVELDGFEITVRGPPPATSEPWDWRGAIADWWPAVFGAAAFGFLLWRLRPLVRRWRERRRAAYRASADYAFDIAAAAINDRKLGAALTATGSWWRRFSDAESLPPKLATVFQSIGAARFGRSSAGSSDTARNWSDAR